MTLKENLTSLRDQPLIGPIVRWLTPRSDPLVTVVRLSGIIGGTATPLNPHLSLATVAGDLAAAFAHKSTKAVALAINSPGGSPVQSALIMKRIRALAAEKDIPVYAFIEDVGASGGYMLALAADEIYADESSIVGSIGVVSASFGFNRLIERVGIDRRIHTAGESKAMLDPFKPEDPKDVDHLEKLQAEVHESFKQLVRSRRDGHLAQEEDDLFSGAFWTGARAKTLGLVDGLGDMRTILREKFGDKTRLKLVHTSGSYFRRKHAAAIATATPPPDTARLFAPDLAANALAALEARALWSRYGL